ncbi:hypothetical protein ACF1B0_35270, partial [Streptomyces anandii]|uniref:hypothetical protein n=1 Tax=Streptomyces anandii TaxID=285454 RepID=UPI0036F5E84C
ERVPDRLRGPPDPEQQLTPQQPRSAVKLTHPVRYVMPVMVEVDCDDDKVTRVVTLPEEVREDRERLAHLGRLGGAVTGQPLARVGA